MTLQHETVFLRMHIKIGLLYETCLSSFYSNFTFDVLKRYVIFFTSFPVQDPFESYFGVSSQVNDLKFESGNVK